MTQPVLAVGAFVFRGDSVLLIRRNKAPYATHWTLPGGRVEPGESLHEALARELNEETGLVATTVGALVCVVESIAPSHHYVILDYLVAAAGEPTAGSDASDAAWFDLAQCAALSLTPKLLPLLELAWRSTRQSYVVTAACALVDTEDVDESLPLGRA